MSNEWNANTRIWETHPPLNTAGSSTSDNFYGGAPSQYYNAQQYESAQVYQTPSQMVTQQQYESTHMYQNPAQTVTQQPYESAQMYQNPSQTVTRQQYESAQVYQNSSQMVSGYSYNHSRQLGTKGSQDASLVLKAVDTLNQIGGLDIDPALISELSKHIKNDHASDQPPSRSEIYSPTFNSPTPSPERKSSNDGFEVDGKKLVSSRPFYEQFNHYEDDTDTHKTSKTNQFSTHIGKARRSRSLERKVRSPHERTWAGSPSPSPPQRHHRTQYNRSDIDSSLASRRSPSEYSRSRYEERSRSRNVRSRSPVMQTRSKSRESTRVSKFADPDIKEKVFNLLSMSKNENRKFVDAQQSSNVLLVMNLQSWITDKVLWGAIHKYAREYGTKPPFYIEKASFHLSKDIGETNLALIAFTTISAAEMCIMHLKCELEVTGRQKTKFKMMYYNENTILFEALNHKFLGIWRAVVKMRAKLRQGSPDPPEINQRRRTRERNSRDRSSHRTESVSHRSENNSERKTKRIDIESSIIKSDEIKSPPPLVVVEEEETMNSEPCERKKLAEEENISEETKPHEAEPVKNESINKSQPNIIKTNVLIGKMKSYLIKQNKTKPEKDEDDFNKKPSVSTNSMLDQNFFIKQEKQEIESDTNKNEAYKSASCETKAKLSQNKSVSEQKVQPKNELSSSNTKKTKSSKSIDEEQMESKTQPKNELSNSGIMDQSFDKRKDVGKVEPKIDLFCLGNKRETKDENLGDIKKDEGNIQPNIKLPTSSDKGQTNCHKLGDKKIKGDIQSKIELPSSSIKKQTNSDKLGDKKNNDGQPKIEHPGSIDENRTTSDKLIDKRKGDECKINISTMNSTTVQKLSNECKTVLSKEIEKETNTNLNIVMTTKVESKKELIPAKNSTVDTVSSEISVSKEDSEKKYEKKFKKKSDENLTDNNIKCNMSGSKELPVEKTSMNKQNVQKDHEGMSVMSKIKKEPSNANLKEYDQINSKNKLEQQIKNSDIVGEGKMVKTPSSVDSNKAVKQNPVKTEDKSLCLSQDNCNEIVVSKTHLNNSDKKSVPSRNDKNTPEDGLEESRKKSSVEKDLDKTKEAKNKIKRKLSPKREHSRSVKVRKEENDNCLEDPESAREREEEEAELFGKGLDKYRPMHDRFNRRRSRSREFNRRDDSPYHRSREDRFGKRGGYRHDNRRPNWEHPGHNDKRRREEIGFDDIDGNEDGYWSQSRESSKPSTSVNPWIQNESLENKVSLSLKELRDPEFLLRVLLQTSILIQNNQLTMTNPLDSLTPTDKDLIIQTLNEIEATSQVVIYATLNDKSKFNAAEHRVLIEALSNIHMFKAALLPAGSLHSNNERVNMNIDEDFKPLTRSENKKEEADVYVSMSYIKHWVTKQHVIKYLRDFNLKFDFVKIQPIMKDELHTTGFIKFKDVESASELLKRTNRILFIGDDKDGIQLNISDVTKKVSKWTCNSCSMKNPYDTLICLKCQKLKEKLRDISVTTEVTNTLALINFKTATSVDEIQRILNKVAPFLKVNVTAHVDSLSDQVINFIVDLPNPQACSMLKKCIRDNMEEFSHIRAGPRVAISFILPNSPKKRVYTFEDVPRLAQYSASLYATTEEERIKYFQHYTTLYTQELVLGNPINVVLPEDTMNSVSVQNTGVPNGTDDRQWPVPNTNLFTYDHNSGYYYDHSTGLYYESSSQYFYNMQTGKFLQYDSARSTYVLVQSSEISSAPVKAMTETCENVPHSKVSETNHNDDSVLKSITTTKESKIHAKKVMKDLVKWSKTVNKQDKKKTISNVFNEDMDNMEKSSPADVGFDILRKTETSKPNMSSVPRISSLIMEHTVCEDEEEEYSFIDWKNFTCNLCHRVFNNAEILNKHSKMSDLHRNNLKQWYISKNLDPDNEELRKQQYRDRAAERRNKTGRATESQSQSTAESWLCSTPGCMSYKKSGFDLCFPCEKMNKAPALPDMSVGSQLLKKMGWEQGTGPGKMGQGNKNIEKQGEYLGLGAQKDENREDDGSYMSFIKRSTQKRYQEASRRY